VQHGLCCSTMITNFGTGSTERQTGVLLQNVKVLRAFALTTTKTCYDSRPPGEDRTWRPLNAKDIRHFTAKFVKSRLQRLHGLEHQVRVFKYALRYARRSLFYHILFLWSFRESFRMSDSSYILDLILNPNRSQGLV
jgi:hypothetical protein